MTRRATKVERGDEVLDQNWTTTADIFDPGKRRGPTMQLRMHQAYSELFDRKQENVDLVMADLAEFSGYFFVTPPGVDPGVRDQMEGRREVFARILSLIALPMTQLEALRVAAAEEQQTSNTEGER